MKISMMNTEQAADALVRMAQPVANILDDKDIDPILQRFSKSKNKSMTKIVADFIPKIVPLALKTHRDDVFEIVGALEGVSADEVRKFPVLKTMAIIRDSFDKDLIDFFNFTADQEQSGKAE